MPTFFSKVFSRGKDKDKERVKDGGKEPASPTTKQGKRASIHSLLEGKFEAVSPAISPSVSKNGEYDHEKEAEKAKEKEKPTLFRPLSRTKASATSSRKPEDVPHLTLNLNLPSLKDDSKKNGNLDVVYESVVVLSDTELGEKRLNASDALKLMRACSNVISSRGLETLGIMHPHWYSSSPAVQRKIISLYLGSLIAPQTSGSAISSNSVASAFEYELEYARDPHDVAAVFRWALRHLKLDGNSFGKDGNDTLGWYDSFVGDEKAKQYPPKAYSEILLSVVKPSHIDLLNATLSLFSSLASHSETNGVSGSRLTMSLGHYLLTGNNVDGLEDWPTFYCNWERAGRALEHIFLASLRDEDSKSKVPKRLAELIAKYPYSKFATDNGFPRPAAFATRAYDALYVQITSELPLGTKPSPEQRLPLKAVLNALKSESGDKTDGTEVLALWDELKKSSTISSDGGSFIDQSEAHAVLSQILSDETISLLSLKSDRTDKASSTVTTFAVNSEPSSKQNAHTNGKAKPTNGSAAVSRNVSEATSEQQSPIASDWNFFSSTGFGEASAGQSLAATLLDSDVEKTQPPPITRRRSQKKRGRSPGASKVSISDTPVPSTPVAAPKVFKTTLVSVVKVDESFVDFWNDALIDPISDSWPSFVVCQLKPSLSISMGEKKITWLVIEQKFVAPPPPPIEEPPSPVRRASSPKPSIRSESEGRPSMAGRVSSTFSATRRRFNFFGGGASGDKAVTVGPSENKEAKRPARGVLIGEMGEIIQEEPAPTKMEAEPKVEQSEEKGANVAAVVAGVAVAGAGAAIATAAEKALEVGNSAEKPEVSKEPIEQKEEVKEEAVIDPTLGTKDDENHSVAEAKGIDAGSTTETKEGVAKAITSNDVPSVAVEHDGESLLPDPVVVEEGPSDQELVTTEDIIHPETAPPATEDATSIPPVISEISEVAQETKMVEAKEEPSLTTVETVEELAKPAPSVVESVPEVAAETQATEHEDVPVDIPTMKAEIEGEDESAVDPPHAEDVPTKQEESIIDAPQSTAEVVEEPSTVPPVPPVEESITSALTTDPLATDVPGVTTQDAASEEFADSSKTAAEEPKSGDDAEPSTRPTEIKDDEPVSSAALDNHIAEADVLQKPEEAHEPVPTSAPAGTLETESSNQQVQEPTTSTDIISDDTSFSPSEPAKVSSDEEIKTEDVVIGLRPGADGSRFVEQLHTPPESEAAGPEPQPDVTSSETHDQDQSKTETETESDPIVEPSTPAAPEEPKAESFEESETQKPTDVEGYVEPEETVVEAEASGSADTVPHANEVPVTEEFAAAPTAHSEPATDVDVPVSSPEVHPHIIEEPPAEETHSTNPESEAAVETVIGHPEPSPEVVPDAAENTEAKELLKPKAETTISAETQTVESTQTANVIDNEVKQDPPTSDAVVPESA